MHFFSIIAGTPLLRFERTSECVFAAHARRLRVTVPVPEHCSIKSMMERLRVKRNACCDFVICGHIAD